jgi:hypothetical protein
MEILKNTDIYNNLIIYNDNYDNDLSSKTRPNSNNTDLLDILSTPDIFNKFLQYEIDLKNKNNYYKMALTSKYDLRPEKIANEVYGNQLLYPIILIANDLCSILQFRIDQLNYEANIPTPEIVEKLLLLLKDN